MSWLPLWATRAQSQWRPLEDDVEYTSELSWEGVRKLGHLSTMPISQWWKVLPGDINSQALPLWPAVYMLNTWALGSDADAISVYRTVHQASGSPPGWAEEDDRGHQHWPGNSREGGNGEEGKNPTFTKCRALTSFSTFHLVFIIPILLMRECDLLLVMRQLSGSVRNPAHIYPTKTMFLSLSLSLSLIHSFLPKWCLESHQDLSQEKPPGVLKF